MSLDPESDDLIDAVMALARQEDQDAPSRTRREGKLWYELPNDDTVSDLPEQEGDPSLIAARLLRLQRGEYGSRWRWNSLN